jgi:DNA sulfur modification protein DndE
MKAPFDTLRLSAVDKERISKIRRLTAIPTMNIICRWALSVGLKHNESYNQDSDVAPKELEIKWEVFAGEFSDILDSIINIEFKSHNTTNLFKNEGDFAHKKIKLGLAILARPGAIRSLEDIGDFWF